MNNDPTPFDFHMNNVKQRILPGADRIVPWDIAATLFGDPRLVNDGRNQHRTVALKRARGNFNYMLGIESDEEFEARRPKIEVYDTENNERIYMLIEDPEGEMAGTSLIQTSNETENEMMRRQIARMESQIAMLTQRLTANPAPMAEGQQRIVTRDSGPELSALDLVHMEADDDNEDVLVDAAGNPINPDAFAPTVVALLPDPEAKGDELPAATADVPTITPVAPAEPEPTPAKTRLAKRG